MESPGKDLLGRAETVPSGARRIGGLDSRVGLLEFEPPEQTGEIVGVPTVPEYQGDRDRLRVITRPKGG